MIPNLIILVNKLDNITDNMNQNMNSMRNDLNERMDINNTIMRITQHLFHNIHSKELDRKLNIMNQETTNNITKLEHPKKHKDNHLKEDVNTKENMTTARKQEDDTVIKGLTANYKGTQERHERIHETKINQKPKQTHESMEIVVPNIKQKHTAAKADDEQVNQML